MSDEHKVCTKCHEDKPLHEYGRRYDGKRAQCKECDRKHRQLPGVRERRLKYLKEWRERNPDYWKVEA